MTIAGITSPAHNRNPNMPRIEHVRQDQLTLQHTPHQVEQGAMNTADITLCLKPSGRNIRMLLVFAVISLSMVWAADSAQYPDNFRRWVHVGTGVILPGDLPGERARNASYFCKPESSRWICNWQLL